MNNQLTLNSQKDILAKLIIELKGISEQENIEKTLTQTLEKLSENVAPDSDDYYSILNYYLYMNILNLYKFNEEKICFWRFSKKLSPDQLSFPYEQDSPLEILDYLVRIYFYSEPLDDLTCLFIPINDSTMIKGYLNWIKSYFYDENYPTSLLWLYALDSSLAEFLPDEIIYLGKRLDSDVENIMKPDFNYEDSFLIKRFSDRSDHYITLTGKEANYEFQQLFSNLENDYNDRCLSRTGKQNENTGTVEYNREWEKFGQVLEFGVSDQYEHGCISFSDLRNSTAFLNKYGKNFFRNQIQQPFFEKTKLISKLYHGRIDKFMGDNVMCVFLQKESETDIDIILKNFLSLFALNKILLDLLEATKLVDSALGLRSGVSFGQEILRSNLGNELVRDFTVTGETVNFAARLEHFSINELKIHNQEFFQETINRFPQISELTSVTKGFHTFNPETIGIIQKYTLYQNIISNLERLDKARFDLRLNNPFYEKLREHLLQKDYKVKNPETAGIYGYEEYEIEGFNLKFYFSFFRPKGFKKYEKIWLLPLSIDMLNNLDISTILKS